MKKIQVVAGIIIDNNKQVCLAKRKYSQHLAGLWEFSGGKIEIGENHLTALKRELKEELAIDILETKHFLDISYSYPEKKVMLHFYLISKYKGTPTSNEGQEIKWFPINKIKKLQIPLANKKVLNKLLQEFKIEAHYD